jgi:hypothetical protein
MIRAIVVRIDGGRRIVVCSLREGGCTLQTGEALELGFCVAQLGGQCGMLGAFGVEQLSFEEIRLVAGRCALECIARGSAKTKQREISRTQMKCDI